MLSRRPPLSSVGCVRSSSSPLRLGVGPRRPRRHPARARRLLLSNVEIESRTWEGRRKLASSRSREMPWKSVATAAASSLFLESSLPLVLGRLRLRRHAPAAPPWSPRPAVVVVVVEKRTNRRVLVVLSFFSYFLLVSLLLTLILLILRRLHRLHRLRLVIQLPPVPPSLLRHSFIVVIAIVA